MKKYFSLCIGLFVRLETFAQQTEAIDTAAIRKIKDEGLNHSKVMSILSMLTDVYGPRLTNSPNHKKAADYAKATLESYGLQNVQLDYWGDEFGRGWQLKKFSLQSTEPVNTPLISYPKAWTPGIKGAVTSDEIYLDVKTEDDLGKYKGKLKDKIVLFSNTVAVKPGFIADASRLHDTTLLQMANAGFPESGGGRGGFNMNRDAQKLNFLKWDFCMKEGVLAVLAASSGSRLEDGKLTVSAATVPYPPEVPRDKRAGAQSANVPKILPQIVVGDGHYNRLVRQIQNGVNVRLELVLETEFTPTGQG